MQQPHLRRLSADAHREIRRAGAAAGQLGQSGLDDPVLQGVEGDDREPSAGLQMGGGGFQELLRLAGCCFSRSALAGMAERMMSASSRVVSMGLSALRRQMAPAIGPAYRSSP